MEPIVQTYNLPQVIRSYEHKLTLKNTEIVWPPLQVAYRRIITNDNWMLIGVTWSMNRDAEANKITNLRLEYAQYINMTYKNSNGSKVEFYEKASAEIRLQLIKLGYLPLDKLKELSRREVT